MRRRWKWAALCVVASVAVAAALSFTTDPVYESTAQLTYVRQVDVSSALGGSSSSVVSSLEAQVQAQTYAELMSTREMKARAEGELGRSLPADIQVTSDYVPDTSVLRINVRSGDPAEAQKVVDAYADGFSSWRRAVAQDQYAEAEKAVRQKIKEYDGDPAKLTSPEYIQLVQRLQNIEILKPTATGNFLVAAHGQLPVAPVLPRHTRDVMLGLLVGIVLAVGAVVLLEQLDIKAHTAEDVGSLLGLPILARFPRLSRHESAETSVALVASPSDPSAEATRMLRGNLDFVDVERSVRSIIITSAAQGEGKTTTISNLAVALARTGSNVLVLDCDLRRPRIHRFFGISNKLGLSTIVAGKSPLEDCLHRIDLGDLDASIQDEASKGSLTVLTSGPLPPNPGEIVASRRLGTLLEGLEARFDYVLIDSPPFLVVGDSFSLARIADGLIVVTRLGITTKAMLRESAEALAPLPCAKLGVVVTGIPVETDVYRYRYKYYRDKSAEADEGLEAAQSPPVAQPLTRG